MIFPVSTTTTAEMRRRRNIIVHEMSGGKEEREEEDASRAVIPGDGSRVGRGISNCTKMITQSRD